MWLIHTAILLQESANSLLQKWWLASEDSGRPEDGVMHIGWIKSRLRKVKITLPPMSQSDVSAALDAVLGKKYYIEYIDPIDGLKQLYVYTSAGSAELYNARIHGGLWYNISFNAIEIGGSPSESEV